MLSPSKFNKRPSSQLTRVRIIILSWLRYLCFPVLGISIYALLQNHSFLPFLALGLLCLLCIWTCFIEPQWIQVRHTTIDVGFSSRIALIADVHLGPLKTQRFLRRVVLKINKLDIDYVLVAGDWTYEPRIDHLDQLFSPLKEVKVPIFGVLGNHDVERPGPILRNELVEVLEKYGVKMLNNDIVSLEKFTLVGLGDYWAREDDAKILEGLSGDTHTIVLMHNPDSIDALPHPISKGLCLAGHTHGGQIRIPFIYKKIISTKGNYDAGYTEEPNGKLFITSGIGEVAVSMRFLNPSRIELLELR